MHGTLVNGNILVSLLGVDLVDGVGGNGGRVQTDDVKRSLRALGSLLGLGDLEVPKARCASDPGRAENLVGFAVQVTEIGRGRVSGKQEDGFLINQRFSDFYSRNDVAPLNFCGVTHVESLVGALTTAKASFVSSSHEDKPFLSCPRWFKGGLPVRKVYRGDSLLLDLLLDHLLNGNHGSRGREVILGLVEPTLHTISQRDLLLRRSKRGEDSDERSEAHGASKSDAFGSATDQQYSPGEKKGGKHINFHRQSE